MVLVKPIELSIKNSGSTVSAPGKIRAIRVRIKINRRNGKS